MNNNSNMNQQNQSNSTMSNNAQQGMNNSAQSMNSNAQQQKNMQNGISSAQIDSNIEAYKKAQQNSNKNSMQ